VTSSGTSNPSAERWLAHFVDDLRSALDAVEFKGFHLDQYGAPKRALRLDGSVVELEEAFPGLLERLAVDVPEARMIFNNVNDFPTWTTARATQSAIYIEALGALSPARPSGGHRHEGSLVRARQGGDPRRISVVLSRRRSRRECGGAVADTRSSSRTAARCCCTAKSATCSPRRIT